MVTEDDDSLRLWRAQQMSGALQADGHQVAAAILAFPLPGAEAIRPEGGLDHRETVGVSGDMQADDAAQRMSAATTADAAANARAVETAMPVTVPQPAILTETSAAGGADISRNDDDISAAIQAGVSQNDSGLTGRTTTMDASAAPAVTPRGEAPSPGEMDGPAMGSGSSAMVTDAPVQQSMEMGNIQLPQFDDALQNLATPMMRDFPELPSLSLPSLTLPSLNIPSPTLTAIEWPDTGAPTLASLESALPNLETLFDGAGLTDGLNLAGIDSVVQTVLTDFDNLSMQDLSQATTIPSLPDIADNLPDIADNLPVFAAPPVMDMTMAGPHDGGLADLPSIAAMTPVTDLAGPLIGLAAIDPAVEDRFFHF